MQEGYIGRIYLNDLLSKIRNTVNNVEDIEIIIKKGSIVLPHYSTSTSSCWYKVEYYVLFGRVEEKELGSGCYEVVPETEYAIILFKSRGSLSSWNHNILYILVK